MDQDLSLRAAALIIASLMLSLLGMCAGFIFGVLLHAVPGSLHATSIWALAWTVLGALQGAAVAPAFCLGRGGALRLPAALILIGAALATSSVALAAFYALACSATVALMLGVGLLLFGAAPLTAYLLGRREVSPAMPVAL